MKKQWQKDLFILCGIGATYLLAAKYKKLVTVTAVVGRFLLSRNKRKENFSVASQEPREDEPLIQRPRGIEKKLHHDPKVVH